MILKYRLRNEHTGRLYREVFDDLNYAGWYARHSLPKSWESVDIEAWAYDEYTGRPIKCIRPVEYVDNYPED